MKLDYEPLITAAIIIYVAFFTNPTPRFISQILESAVGKLVILVGIVFVAMRKPLIGLFLGIAFIISTYPAFEFLDEKEQKPEKEKEQPKSGAPKVDMAQIGKLAQMIGKGKGEKLPTAKGKDVTTPPPATNPVKPHAKENFTSF
jgi:hypothetical protein